MNYIQTIATDVAQRSCSRYIPGDDYAPLWEFYAVLVLTTGTATTNRNVHDALSAWRTSIMPDYQSLVPFEDLTPDVQTLGVLYRKAIVSVAASIPSKGDTDA